MKVSGLKFSYLAVSLLVAGVALQGCSKKSAEMGSAPQMPAQPQQQQGVAQQQTQHSLGEAAPAAQSQAQAPSAQAQAPTQAQPMVAAEAPKPLEIGCFAMTFKHKPMAEHANGEACAQHRNLIKLTGTHAQTQLNSKSVCVRVNGKPVAFDLIKPKKSDQPFELMLGPVAGPQAKVSVRYCTGKAICKEECKVPKDEFMEAIGGDDSDHPKTARKGAGKWSDEGGEDADVTAELDQEIQRELASVGQLKVFEEWLPEQEAPACSLAKL